MKYPYYIYYTDTGCEKLNYNIYILGVLTEQPHSKPLECNVVYISITTASQAT